VVFKCPQCLTEHELGAGRIGLKVECPCGKKFHITDELVVVRETPKRNVGETISITWDNAPPPGADLTPPTQPEQAAPPADPHSSSTSIFPTVIGKTRIIRQIGRGAWGVVFLAEHTTLNISVALKIISPRFAQNRDAVERFYREAKTSAKLNHPNIVRVLDCGTEGSLVYIVMEYINGGNLKTLVQQKGPMPLAQALDVLHSMALALEEAERHNIIHRDIKPDNIMISGQQQYKLADLGLAREEASTATHPELTAVSVAMGTPHYMSPEQALDARNVDTRADIYSLGCTFYYLLSGEPPYPGMDVRQILLNHVNGPIPHITDKVPSLSKPIDLIIRKCMAKEPADRYQNATELLQDIGIVRKNRFGVLIANQEPPDPGQPATVGKPGKSGKSQPRPEPRKPILLMAAIALMTVLVIALGIHVATRGAKRSPVQPAGAKGSTVPTDPREQEMATLIQQMANPQLLPEQRVIYKYRAAGMAAQLGKLDECMTHFTGALEATQELSVDARKDTMVEYKGALEYLFAALADKPDKLEEYLFLLTPRINASLGERSTTVESNYLTRLVAPLGLHCKVTALPGFRVRFEYPFSSVDELADFIQPSRDWALGLDGKWVERQQQWAVLPSKQADQAGALVVGVDYPSALFWNMPHGKRFVVRYRAANLPKSEEFGYLSFTCCATGVPSLSYADGGVRLIVAGEDNAFNEVAVSENKVVTKTAFSVIQEQGKPDWVSVEIEATLPRLRFQVNDQEVFNGNLPDAFSAEGSYMGPITMWKSVYSNLTIELPVADLMWAVRKGRTHVYPLMGFGTDRFDTRSSCCIGELAAFEASPVQNWAAISEEDTKRLSAANGRSVKFRGTRPSVYAKFPISTALTEAGSGPRDIHVYTVSKFTSETKGSPEEPDPVEQESSDKSRKHFSGTVQLFESARKIWLQGELVSCRVSSSQDCFLSHFVFRNVDVTLVCDPMSEVLLRHMEPRMDYGSMRIGHMALKL